MKNAFAIATLCLGIFALAPAASAGDMNADNLKDCFKPILDQVQQELRRRT